MPEAEPAVVTLGPVTTAVIRRRTWRSGSRRSHAGPSPSNEPACTTRATRPPGSDEARTSPLAATARSVGNPTSMSAVSVGSR